MSCGRPHDKDCGEVLGDLFAFIDNELDSATCTEIQQHLDECAPCLAEYGLEQTVKSLVARSCREHAPESLRQRVLLQVRQVHVEITEVRRPGISG
ncbi:MAG TPA: mycothiol system anti-sigma-R factor [Nocardioidaceae bacterium]|nr:mycothiol system anti-sigma-R factor [Nocardioidaceae bacterium]